MTGRNADVKVDYDKIARRYDAFRGGGGPYLEALVNLAREVNAARVLEIGAGTGNNTAAFNVACPETFLAACDLSWGMIHRAREKGVPGGWLRADAHFLPLTSESIDFCFGCFMLHYISDLPGLFRECFRVLRQGAAAFVTASHEFIERHPMNRYFPSFAAVDKARFPSLSTIKAALSEAGFPHVSEKRILAPPRPIDRAYLERVENQFISTYSLLPEDEFRSGVARLRADIEARGRLDVDMAWESVTIWGRKRPA